MRLLRTHPLFSTVMIILLIVIAAQLWFVLSGETEERSLENQLQFRLAEIERLQAQKPAPNERNLQAAKDDFVQNALVLSGMLRSLNVAGPDELEYFRGEPTRSTDAYFDIAQFVERMQEAARVAGVALKPDERFGFGMYTNVGPELNVIRPVYRQRRIVEYLLQALFSARPRALISVQREEPKPVVVAGVAASSPQNTASAPTAVASGNGNGAAAAGDFFMIDSQVSARTPEYVETMPVRIAFAGQTAALRGFLNALAVPEIPLVVRSVEVEPGNSESVASAGGGARRGGPPAGLFGRPSAALPVAPASTQANVPIVSENDSRFTVTVELFEVKIRAPDLVEAEAP